MIDEYGFERLDLNVEGLRHEFDVRWKLLPATPGPPGYPAEPYIPLAGLVRDDERRPAPAGSPPEHCLE